MKLFNVVDGFRSSEALLYSERERLLEDEAVPLAKNRPGGADREFKRGFAMTDK